mmetsp:Transcript_14034/g.47391  ORF Transcript_14034/g.47391 Transcript_14034/m.47391 type:complete len:233 (+) Transcript_14034:967-1665(+)
MSVLGAERQNWMSPILAFSTRVGPPAVRLAPRSSTSPCTISVSSTVPPTCFTTFTSRRSTLVATAGSMTERTASTAMGDSVSAFWWMIFELRHVFTALTRVSRSDRSTGRATARRYTSACAAARLKASEMSVGWMPLLSSSEQACSSAPAMTHTDVVPSPASMSWDLDSCTSICAVGWNTCSWLRIVAPSLVMSTSPSPFWIILSMPRGPREVRTASATARAATMLLRRTSF